MQPTQEQPPAQAPAPPTTVPDAGWQFKAEDAAAAPLAPDMAVNWSGSEYIAHAKPGGWYLILAAGAFGLTAVIYFITRDIISVITIVVVAILFGVVAGRKPRVLQYAIDNQGIRVGSKIYPFSMFKSFSIVREGHISSIYLDPLKRFMNSITMYYPPEEEQRVLEVLGSYLPMEERKQDGVDRLMHRIRF